MRKLIPVLALLLAVSCGREGRVCIDGDVPVIELRGSWYQMGRQYGKVAKGYIEDVLSYLDEKIGPDADRQAAADSIADKLFSTYPDYLTDFFNGVSVTSGLSLERLKLCNAAEYVEGVFLCSAMAVWDDYGAGKLVFGRNYDAVSYPEIARDLVVTVFHPSGEEPAAIVGYAGELYCVNGFNASGIFVELNNGMPSAGAEIHWELCASTTNLFNLLFGARSLDDVDDFFNNTRSFASFIIGVADKDEARSYEWCYDGVRRGDNMTDAGLMVSTNHYVHNSWEYPLPSDENSWDSITRRRNILDRAQEFKGSIGIEKMKEIMGTPIAEGGPMHINTRYQIVAVPEDMTLHIKVRGQSEWSEINLSEYFDQPVRRK